MTTHLRRWDALTLTLLAGATACTAALYERLPAHVPVHFDLTGQADRAFDKPVGAWLLLAVAGGVWLLLRLGPRAAPHDARERMEASPMAGLAFLLTSLLVTMHGIVLWTALHPGASVGVALSSAFGLFWALLGLVMPRVRRNPWVGVRTAWTLASDENWARTHRFAGLACFFGGLATVAAAIGGLPTLALATVLASAAAPVAYSFVLAHRLPRA